MKVLVLCLALALFFVGAAYGACSNNRVCPANYDPVCGKRVIRGRTEFRTFGNMCTFNSCPEGFKIVRKGECRR